MPLWNWVPKNIYGLVVVTRFQNGTVRSAWTLEFISSPFEAQVLAEYRGHRKNLERLQQELVGLRGNLEP